jgi:SAM-dependent methyltransferase
MPQRVTAAPPAELMQAIGGAHAFFETGEEFASHLRDLAGLQPSQAVLDVGCGCGRMALPLTGFLAADGRYEGFDVNPASIEWCGAEITSRRANFRFQHVDVYNGLYNPLGHGRMDAFRFPYASQSFDVVLLASVFTHLLPVDVLSCAREVARVLRPGGRCLATFFLFKRESRQLIDSAASEPRFPLDLGQCCLSIAETPEAALAYEENFVRRVFAACGLESPDFHYGSWTGREVFLSYQDIVVAARSDAPVAKGNPRLEAQLQRLQVRVEQSTGRRDGRRAPSVP